MMIAGLGPENLRLVEVDETFAMRPEALAAPIAADQAAGLTPCLCLRQRRHHLLQRHRPGAARIGAICRSEGMWLHVDGAMAGTAAVCPEFRWIIDGLELADSLLFQPAQVDVHQLRLRLRSLSPTARR